jgi:hypothetical protein
MKSLMVITLDFPEREWHYKGHRIKQLNRCKKRKKGQ